MKNLLNNISQEEKNRILEMHSSKKNVMTEQSLGGVIDWAKEKINSALGNSSFKAQATVEDDMVMEFSVVDIQYSKGSGVNMRIKDQTDGNKLLYVNNFEGPIFDVQSGKKKYTDSIFTNINSNNWKSIAKQNKIPVSEVMK